MNVTVGDVQKLPEFGGMQLIAGESGLNNVVTSCGFLDYEYEKQVKDKYSTSFDEGQLVITTFLYAKDNEFLLMDAVKGLISKGCCALVIKNIFKVPIHDSMLRYADSRKFPIFLIKDHSIYLESMIVRITELIRQYSSVNYMEIQTDSILNVAEYNTVNTVRSMNPSFGSELMAIFFRCRQRFMPNEFFGVEGIFKECLSHTDSVFYYKNGVMLIHTCELFASNDVLKVARKYIDASAKASIHFYIGVSNLHHSLSEFKDALKESIYASMLNASDMSEYVLYRDIGVYQILMPLIEEPYLRAFSDGCTRLLQDYDHEAGTSLFETAVQFVQSGGNITDTAKIMRQHKNTIRYRLDKISAILNESMLSKDGYEKLSIAIKIYICQSSMRKFKESALNSRL